MFLIADVARRNFEAGFLGTLERVLPVIAQKKIKRLKPFGLARIWRPNKKVYARFKIKMLGLSTRELPIKTRYGQKRMAHDSMTWPMGRSS